MFGEKKIEIKLMKGGWTVPLLRDIATLSQMSKCLQKESNTTHTFFSPGAFSVNGKDYWYTFFLQHHVSYMEQIHNIQ